MLADYRSAGSGTGAPADTGLSYTHDALERLAAGTDAAGTWAWTYDGNTGRALTLTDPDGNVVSYTYDAAGQRDTLGLTAAGQQQATMELDYSYVAGRLAGIAASETVGGVSRSAAYAYSYLANSNLLATVVSNNGSADVLALVRTYDDAGRLLSIAGSRPAPLGPASSFTYGLDELGRRVSRTDLDGSRLDYTYNPRDELTGAVRSNQPAAAPFGEYPYSYGYEFDRIGNHLRQTKNGTEFRGRYNNLNELIEREIAGAVRVQGAADGVLPIGVKVDGRDAQTQNVDADTAAFRGDSPLRPRQTGEKAISIVATDSNQPPKRTEALRTVQLPPANPLRYSYDANGNLVSDGVWSYTWTTECRLAAIAPATPGAQAVRLEFVYDGEGRRRWRKAYTWDTQAEDWVLAAETTFVYDGWNLIRETTTDHTQTPAAVSARGYVWGLDLSQTLQGAGGVGGLLSVSSADRSSFVAYDGNGNVAALVDAANGSVSAEYDYSPFGETLKAAGAAADSNPFRFSTKYSEQPASGPELLYFGFRFYAPGVGRWVSRDPVGERGGPSLWAFLRNHATGSIDPLGLEERKCCLKQPLKLCWLSMDLSDGTVLFRQTARFEHAPGPPKCCDATCCEYKQVVRGGYRRLHGGQWFREKHKLTGTEYLRPNEFLDDGFNREKDKKWYRPCGDGTADECYEGRDRPGIRDRTNNEFGNWDAELWFVAYVSDMCRGMGLVGAVPFKVRVEPYSYPAHLGPPKRYDVQVEGMPKCAGPAR